MLDTIHKAVGSYSKLREGQTNKNIAGALHAALTMQEHYDFEDALSSLLEVKEVKKFAQEETQEYLKVVIDAICNGSFRYNNNFDLYTDKFDWFFDQKFTQKIMDEDPVRSAFTVSAVVPAMQGRYMFKETALVHAGISQMKGANNSYDMEHHALLIKRPHDGKMKIVKRSLLALGQWSDHADYTNYLKRKISERNEVNGDELKTHFGILSRLQGELIVSAQNMGSHWKHDGLKERTLAHFDAWYEQAGEAMQMIADSGRVFEMKPSGGVFKHRPML